MYLGKTGPLNVFKRFKFRDTLKCVLLKNQKVYVLQPTSPPVNDTLMELLLIISTARRASAKRITAIIPYYGYARQDRKVDSRTPISAADVARMLESMGVDRVVALDLHCGQIQGFFSPSCPADNLEAHFVALDWIGRNVEFGGKVNRFCFARNGISI